MVPACDIRNEWLAVAAAARCSRGGRGEGGVQGRGAAHGGCSGAVAACVWGRGGEGRGRDGG